MGTRGFRIVRYRGRYYCYYNGLDSYPESLGEEIRRQIPTDREKYTEWLIGQRRHYEDLYNKFKDYLSVRQYDSGEEVRENGRSTARPQMIGDNPNNTNLPSYMPEDLDEHDAAWAYIVDLDREVFTINKSAHMKLFRIPKHGWIAAIVESASDIRFSHTEKIILRGLLPLGCVTDLVLHVEPIATEILDSYNMLAVGIVIPKTIHHIAPSQRHGSLLSAYIYFKIAAGPSEDPQKPPTWMECRGSLLSRACTRHIMHRIAVQKSLSCEVPSGA